LEINETLREMVELQRIDSGLDELEKLKKQFLQKIEALNGHVSIAKNDLAAAKKKQDELAKTRHLLEMEISTLDAKLKKYIVQQASVTSAMQADALEKEIEKAKADKALAEEKVLELMMGDDEQKALIQKLSQTLAEKEKEAMEGKAELEVKIGDCEKASADKLEERQKQLPQVEEEYLRVYESLRKGGKKLAVAIVERDGTCGGCKMNVAPQAVNEMRKKRSIERCTCGRYLYLRD